MRDVEHNHITTVSSVCACKQIGQWPTILLNNYVGEFHTFSREHEG